MNNQEAIETLKFLLSIERHHKEPLRMAIKALEKQTPKKPNYVYENESLCPYCGAVLDYCESPCENCNQFIDWSEKE